MSASEYKSKGRRTISIVEPLDDRLLLSGSVPPTPAPAPSPFSVAMVRRFEQRIERIDRTFMFQSRQLNTLVARRAALMESIIARVASRAQVQVQSALTAGTTPQVSITKSRLTNQVTALVATSNNRLNELNNSVQRKFSIFANSFEQSDARFGIPVNAFENNLRAARAGFTTSVTSAVSSITTQVVNQSGNLANLVSSARNSSSNTGTTGTSTTGTSSVGTTQTQTFNNAFTQSFSSINATINQVDSSLSQIFGAFNSNVTALLTSLSTSPLGSFQPALSFVSGNGVTFTGSTSPIVSIGGTTGTSSVA